MHRCLHTKTIVSLFYIISAQIASTLTESHTCLETLEAINNGIHIPAPLLSLFEALGIDPSENTVPRQTPNALFSHVDATPIEEPIVVSFSKDTLIDIFNQSLPIQHQTFLNILSNIVGGNMTTLQTYLYNSRPFAHCYCGHQFGYFSGQLGDGRALSLGFYHYNYDHNHYGQISQDYNNYNYSGNIKLSTNNGDRSYNYNYNNLWELQLKGSGRTPYSRRGDGRAVLRSSIREYLMSEAMYYLGIPTSRALMLVTSDKTKVKRDMFYNGNIKFEPTAIVLRIAPNFIRFGTFEIHLQRDNRQGPSYNSRDYASKMLTKLIDFVIDNYYQHDIDSFTHQQHQSQTSDYDLHYDDKINFEKHDKYEKWWKLLVDRSISLLVEWEAVGFVHGVLNTDNLSILGIGIDYGPFGMMEYFDNNYIPNYSDEAGRYSYKNQKNAFKFNLEILAQALYEAGILNLKFLKPSHGDPEPHFDKIYKFKYFAKMKLKFGIVYPFDNSNYNIEKTNNQIIAMNNLLNVIFWSFFDTLEKHVCDFTNSFRLLNLISINGIGNKNCAKNGNSLIASKTNACQLKEAEQFAQQVSKYCIKPSQFEKFKLRKKMIKYHHFYQEQMQTNQQSSDIFNVDVSEMTEQEKYSSDLIAWQKFAQLYQYGVDSQWDIWLTDYNAMYSKHQYEIYLKELNKKRMEIMNNNNPVYILRNYMLQRAIDDAHKGDFAEVNKLLELVKNPYNVQNIRYDDDLYRNPVPEQSCHDFGSCDLLSCSS